jgi:archaellum biogenesis protein FlaJ (TadC family)
MNIAKVINKIATNLAVELTSLGYIMTQIVRPNIDIIPKTIVA